MQIRLDLLGGLAGDMFIAAAIDAFPEHEPGLVTQILSAAQTFAPDVPTTAVASATFNDGILQGRRFDVGAAATAAAQTVRSASTMASSSNGVHMHAGRPSHSHAHPHPHSAGDRGRAADFAAVVEHPARAHVDEGHVAWCRIRERLQETLEPHVAVHALAIFGLLAQAEAEVHGMEVDDVVFHEVGAWDSIADIVGAAWLIDRIGAHGWQSSAVPIGRGRVRTAHGLMPLPAPATALLLRGFLTIDDGIAGERVTPTGAAILRYLAPPQNAGSQGPSKAMTLKRSGVGFGTRKMEGISNCVRMLVFDDALDVEAPRHAQHRELGVVEFEVDDQSAEDLAMGLDRLRRHDAIFDVVQSPVFGKKGRMMTAVRLLARPADIGAVIDACFRETTTIGLRHRIVHGAALTRRADEIVVDGRTLRVKTVDRPGGATAKAESDDVRGDETHHVRRALRNEAERRALAHGPESDDA